MSGFNSFNRVLNKGKQSDMSKESYFIGIDGGGTSCRARLANANGDILAEARAGSANIFQNADFAWASICTVVSDVFNAANIAEPAYSSCHIIAGLAGAGVQSKALAFSARGHRFGSFKVLTDAQIACLGAHDGQDGTILIVGTGTIGVSLQGGVWHRIGGWGFPLHDMGSGAWLGQQAIRYALNQKDGLVEATSFTENVWCLFDGQPEKLIEWSQTASSSDYGKIAPEVLAAYAKQDPHACKIIDHQIQLIEDQINLLTREGLSFCIMGGLSEWVQEHLPSGISNRISKPKGDALHGALTYAFSQRYV